MLHSSPVPMTLPMTATFLYEPCEEGVVAHSLDFDIVAVAPTKDAAIAKVRAAVKLYIEYGIRNRWENDILFSAPQKHWDKLTPDTPISLGEPIQIDDRRMLVFNAESGSESR